MPSLEDQARAIQARAKNIRFGIARGLTQTAKEVAAQVTSICPRSSTGRRHSLSAPSTNELTAGINIEVSVGGEWVELDFQNVKILYTGMRKRLYVSKTITPGPPGTYSFRMRFFDPGIYSLNPSQTINFSSDAANTDGMVPFQTFEKATGELLRPLGGADLVVMEAQCTDEIGFVFGHHDPAKYRVELGEVVPQT